MNNLDKLITENLSSALEILARTLEEVWSSVKVDEIVIEE